MELTSLPSTRGPMRWVFPRSGPAAMERLATLTPYHTGETLYYEADPADFWYRVVSGAARKCAVMADGRRRIVDFLLPGDLFGFDTRFERLFSVEAIVDGTMIARYPRRGIERLAESEPEVGRSVRETAFESIARLQWRMILMGSATALERVSAFLLEMAERSTAESVDAIVLPMSRYDIADYLAIAVETVSRALTELRRRGAIAIGDPRRVRILDRSALRFGLDDGWARRL